MSESLVFINHELMQFLRIPAWRKWGSSENSKYNSLDKLSVESSRYPRYDGTPYESNIYGIMSFFGRSGIGCTENNYSATGGQCQIKNRGIRTIFSAGYVFSENPANFVALYLRIIHPSMWVNIVHTPYHIVTLRVDSTTEVVPLERIRIEIDRLINIPELNPGKGVEYA